MPQGSGVEACRLIPRLAFRGLITAWEADHSLGGLLAEVRQQSWR